MKECCRIAVKEAMDYEKKWKQLRAILKAESGLLPQLGVALSEMDKLEKEQEDE